MVWTVVIATLGPSVAIAQEETAPEVIVEAFMNAWNARDVDRIVSFYADDALYEDVTNVGNQWATPWRGRDAIHDAVREMFAALPDLAFEMHAVRTGKDFAVLEWTMTGTHTGDWPTLPATGRPISVRGVSVLEFAGAAIRRQHDYWDGFRFSSQLGVLSASSGNQAHDVTASIEDALETTPEQNKEIVRRAIAEGVNAGNLEVFRAMLAPDYARHSQATTEMPEIRGVEAMLEFLEASFTTFPDWHEEIELMIAEGDKVAYVTTGTGTQTGPMGDIPPTGKKVEITNYIVQRIENGKIAETWIGWDNLAALVQLGLFPPPDAGGE